MGVSDQLHASTAVSLRNEPPIGIEKEKWMDLETWCALCILLLPGIKPITRPEVLRGLVCQHYCSCILIIWRNTYIHLLCVVIRSCLLMTLIGFVTYSVLKIMWRNVLLQTRSIFITLSVEMCRAGVEINRNKSCEYETWPNVLWIIQTKQAFALDMK
jgi:hypothetical protein